LPGELVQSESKDLTPLPNSSHESVIDNTTVISVPGLLGVRVGIYPTGSVKQTVIHGFLLGLFVYQAVLQVFGSFEVGDRFNVSLGKDDVDFHKRAVVNKATYSSKIGQKNKRRQ
jgi:hypothetical protein